MRSLTCGVQPRDPCQHRARIAQRLAPVAAHIEHERLAALDQQAQHLMDTVERRAKLVGDRRDERGLVRASFLR